MSTVKTKIDSNIVLEHLKANFDPEISEVVSLKGGEGSQAFSFTSNGKAYVIRVNKNSNSFTKDAYVAEFFGSKDIPVPQIIETGKIFEGYFYAISTRAEGKTSNLLTQEEYQAALPDMLAVLDRIHSIDILDTHGYGKWNAEGVAEYDSWKEFIVDPAKHVVEHNLFETTFLEKEVWDRVFREIERLVQYLPEDRCLVHADYGSDNVVIKDGKVTGILDWAESAYGDPVYDVAWLSFWSDRNDPEKKAEAHFRAKKLEHFEERLLCYKLRIGLSSISFFAFSQQKEKYEGIKERTLNLLKVG